MVPTPVPATISPSVPTALPATLRASSARPRSAFASVLLLAALLLTAVLTGGCSDSPTEPGDGPSLTGTWAGQITGIRWQGAPQRDGDLLLVLEESETIDDLRMLDGTFAITFADGDVLTGSLRGAVSHEWYLAWHGEPGCISQMRGRRAGSDGLDGDWSGWNCDAGGGEFEVSRR